MSNISILHGFCEYFNRSGECLGESWYTLSSLRFQGRGSPEIIISTSPPLKSRSGQGICFCAQVVPARGNSIAAQEIPPCIGNLSAGRCLCNCCERSTQVCLMLIFGTQAFFTYIIVPARQLWLKNSLLLNCFFSTFRYRSINVKNLRPLEFAISGFSMTSSLQSGFQRDEDLCKTSLYT